MYTVYMHTTPDGKRYIGVTSRSVNTRWQYGRGYVGNSAFTDAIQKHGWNNIKHEVLEVHEKAEDANAREMFYVAKYMSNNPEFGFNVTVGGDYMNRFRGKKCPPVFSRPIDMSAILRNSNSIGDRIRLLRLARRWPQFRLAAEVSCTRQTIVKWENGKTVPSKIYKDKLACVFGVTVEELEGK